jgi:4-amino-4-deoxy-L-arabinose transferase-like glycosyltransferase
MSLRVRGLVAVGRVTATAPAVKSVPTTRAWEAILLLTALAAYSIVLAPALKETGTPPGWDQAVHLRDSLVYERILVAPEALTTEVFRDILHGSEEHPLLTPSGYYPPFLPGVTALLYLVAGPTYEAAMVTNLVFLALLVWGVWGLGNELAGRPAGVVAALLVLAAPGIRVNAWEYMLDLPLSAMVIVAVWALLQTRGFSLRGRSVVFGLMCGLGMLTKWSFFLFLMAPVIMVLVEGLQEDGKETTARRLANLGLAALCAAIVMAPYYAPIFPILVKKTWVHAGGAADGFDSPFSLESALFHLRAIPRRLLGWPLTVAMLGGILAAERKRSATRKAGLFLLIWAVSLYGVFTFAVANKQSRYLLPWVPVLLLGGTLGILDLWRRRHDGVLGVCRALAAIALLCLAAVGLRGRWEAPQTGDWRISEMVGALKGDLQERESTGRAWKLGVIPDMREINGPTVAYYVARRDLPVTVVQLVNRMKKHVAMEVGLDPFGRGDFYETFGNYDYLLTKTGNNAVPPWETVVPSMMQFFEARKRLFETIAAFDLPDGSQMTLYRRRDR